MRFKLDFQLVLIDDPVSQASLALLKAGDALVLREQHAPGGDGDAEEKGEGGQGSAGQTQAPSSLSGRAAPLAVDLETGMHVGSVPPHAAKTILPWLLSMRAKLMSGEGTLPYRLSVRSIKKGLVDREGDAGPSEGEPQQQEGASVIVQQVLLRIESAASEPRCESITGMILREVQILFHRC